MRDAFFTSARYDDFGLRCLPSREPRRHTILRTLHRAGTVEFDRHREPQGHRRHLRRRRSAHGQSRRQLRCTRRHITAVLRRQGVRGRARRRARSRNVRGVPGDARRSLRRVRSKAGTRWTDRGQRREPGPQAVPLVVRQTSSAILQDRLRLLLRGEVIWQKAHGAAGSCAWGSFQRPANPVLRDLTRTGHHREQGSLRPRGEPPTSAPRTSCRRRLRSSGTSSWRRPPTSGRSHPRSASRVGHPAPFPVELPERLIHLYTYSDDLILDPFMGSGTTAIAAVRTDRHYVGYDTDPEYVAKAKSRVEREKRHLRESDPEPLPRRLARHPDRSHRRRGLSGAGRAGRTRRSRPGARGARGVRLRGHRVERASARRCRGELHRAGQIRETVVLRRFGGLHVESAGIAAHGHALEGARESGRPAPGPEATTTRLVDDPRADPEQRGCSCPRRDEGTKPPRSRCRGLE